MALTIPHYTPITFPGVKQLKVFGMSIRSPKWGRVIRASSASTYIPAAPILVPEGPWQQIPGGVTAAQGFKAAGMYGGLRAAGQKPDLALVTCDVDAICAGAFTTNIVAAAPVLYCKKALDTSATVRLYNTPYMET